VREWLTFCNYVYSEIPEETRYTLNSDNTNKFMLYQAMRPKKAQGGKKRGRVEVDEEEEEAADEDAFFLGVGGQGGGRAGAFCPITYNAVIDKFADSNLQALGDADDLPQPVNPLGLFSQVNTYKAALICIYKLQKTNCQLPELPFAHTIWQHNHQCLMNIVKEGKQKGSKARYDEKMTCEATPYSQVELVPQIESVFWQIGTGRSPQLQMAALRSRHAFLMTFAGIMRYESLHKRNLSDLYSFTWKAEKGIHRFLVTMFQLPSGKLVVNCVLWILFSLFSNPFHPFVLHAQVRPIMVYIFLEGLSEELGLLVAQKNDPAHHNPSIAVECASSSHVCTSDDLNMSSSNKRHVGVCCVGRVFLICCWGHWCFQVCSGVCRTCFLCTNPLSNGLSTTST
jgi:hypothetical protein